MFVEAAIKNTVHPTATVILVNPAFWPMASEMSVLTFPLPVVGPAFIAAGGILTAAFDFALALCPWSAQAVLLRVQKNRGNFVLAVPRCPVLPSKWGLDPHKPRRLPN